MCQTTLDLIHDYSLDGACYNDGNGVECTCGDMIFIKIISISILSRVLIID